MRSNRIIVRPAYAEFESRRGIGGNTVLVTTHQGKGFTFYRGRMRLTAEQALRMLGDRNLEAAYSGFYKKLLKSGGARVTGADWSIGIGFGAMAVGSILMGASFAGSSDSENTTIRSKLLWSGVGVMCVGSLVATIAMMVRRSAIKDQNKGKAFQTIFISSDLTPVLQRAIHRYNRRVDARCGLRPAPAQAPSAPAAPTLHPNLRPLPQPSGVQ